jgi:dienelactone hydrolase
MITYFRLEVICIVVAFCCVCISDVNAQDRSLGGNDALANYFENEVAQIEQANELADYDSLDAWEADKPRLRGELFDMLGLNPLPPRQALDAVITGKVEEAEFVVEKLHFQSLPDLYVTGNLYLPKEIKAPLPTILYLCGHAQVKKGDTSFGNKTAYHRHGAWFARNGYACLMIDSVQLGEIEGVHHGTYRMNRWWWNSRGYTPAGVEAWNCIRALDYLETRPEVDPKRFGVTGRSGGGAYSWWTAALDDRIRCAVPVAGITSLRNHVVDGCVEGHCDCMFMVNTYRWDYAKVAALVAPRPLLISNTDKDTIFPLEGVVDIHRQTRHIYRLYGADDKLGLQITEGPHEDTQELHIHAFRWFNRFLKEDQAMIEKVARQFFEPESLQVLSSIPTDQINTTIDESFVPQAKTPTADSILARQEVWHAKRLAELRDRCFRAWPDHDSQWKGNHQTREEPLTEPLLANEEQGEYRWKRFVFESQPGVELFIDAVHRSTTELEAVKSAGLLVCDGANEAIRSALRDRLAADRVLFVFSPRGIGPHAWQGNETKQIQIQRRFQLIGTTADTMRIWDVRRAMQVLRTLIPTSADSVDVYGSGSLGMHALLASLYEPGVRSLHISSPATKDDSFSVLNLTRVISGEEIFALATVENELSIDPSWLNDLMLVMEVAESPSWKGRRVHISPQP